MTNTSRIQLLKFSGWLILAAGMLFIVGDFFDSGQTFRDFRSAFKGGLPFIALGCLFLTLAGFHQRIHELEQENAALRAEKDRWKTASGNV